MKLTNSPPPVVVQQSTSFGPARNQTQWRLQKFATLPINLLKDTNLSKIENIGGLLRFVDLTPAVFDAGTDFRTTFLDGSVIMTEEFREQMGHPCQWADAVITDDVVFYGRWRGWLEASPPQLRFKELWSDIAPREYVDVVPIPPPLGCAWTNSLMPRSEAK